MFIKMQPSSRSDQRGDTIIEVLISIAIVSLVLAGAYVATNRNLMATRDAQERSDALKLVESQVEQLKHLAATDPDALFDGTAPGSYCIVAAVPTVSSDNACKVNAAGAHTGIQPVYSLAIQYASDTFTITNTWPKVIGGQGSLQMKYRVYD